MKKIFKKLIFLYQSSESQNTSGDFVASNDPQGYGLSSHVGNGKIKRKKDGSKYRHFEQEDSINVLSSSSDDFSNLSNEELEKLLLNACNITNDSLKNALIKREKDDKKKYLDFGATGIFNLIVNTTANKENSLSPKTKIVTASWGDSRSCLAYVKGDKCITFEYLNPYIHNIRYNPKERERITAQGITIAGDRVDHLLGSGGFGDFQRNKHFGDPVITTKELGDGEYYLITYTDGIEERLLDLKDPTAPMVEVLNRCLKNKATPSQIATALTDLALCGDKKIGLEPSNDNISIVVKHLVINNSNKSNLQKTLYQDKAELIIGSDGHGSDAASKFVTTYFANYLEQALSQLLLSKTVQTKPLKTLKDDTTKISFWNNIFQMFPKKMSTSKEIKNSQEETHPVPTTLTAH